MKLLLISGGLDHPFVVTTPIIEAFLKAAGHDVRVTEDASVLREPVNMKKLRCAGLQYETRIHLSFQPRTF